MSQVPFIEKQIGFVHDATECAAIEFDRKATAALVLQQRVAMELLPEDARNLARTLRRMMECHRVLLGMVKAGEQRAVTYRDELTRQMQRAAAADGRADNALRMVESVRDLSLIELIRFRKQLRKGPPA